MDEWTLPLDECLARVERTARGLRTQWVEHEELVAVGNLALVCCLRDHDSSAGPFWPWAVRRIRGAMIDHLRTWTHRGRSTFAVVDLPSDDDVRPALSAHAPDVCTLMDLYAALSCLRPRACDVFLRRALCGLPGAVLAREAGVSESRISQVYGEARAALRQHLA